MVHCLHDLFRRIAVNAPESTAIVSEEGSVSYAELNDRSDRIAVSLRAQGVQEGTFVPLCMRRSIELIVGILGVLKTGAAYVPLDPDYPKERLRTILEEIEATIILTCEAFLEKLPESGARVICLDGDAQQDIGEGEQPVRANGSEEDLACVIYTSGSTGTPKGVMVPHAAIAGLVLDTSYVELSPSDRIGHISNVGFDASSFEIWGALLNGASLVIISKEIVLAPSKFEGELKRRQITVLLMTSAVFEMLAAWNGRIFAGVKQVLFGGDVVNVERVRRVLESGAAPVRLIQVYGPTECATFATAYHVTAVTENAERIPIGWPIRDTSVHVLDRDGNPVGVGTPGELYLGGSRLARGYLKRPELTRERFVHVSRGPGEPERLYRTGDLVKYLTDGSLEFIGRIDRQLKIRGHRVEPAEIERCLDKYPTIASSVAIPKQNSHGQCTLIAFFITAQGQSVPSSSELATHVAATLPEYMVPSLFVPRRQWPLSAHGKLDRDALLNSLRASGRPRDTFATSGSEDSLRKVCREVLGTDSFDSDENLMASGLHSLSAVHFAWLIEERFGVRLRLSEILDHPTIARLLHLIERGQSAGAPAGGRLRVNRRSSRPVFIPLSFAQEQVWFLERLHPHLNSYRFQSLLHCDGALNVEVLEATLNHLVSRHEILRTVFLAEDQMPRQEIRSYVPFDLPLEDLRTLPENARQRQLHLRVHDELRRPFDTAAGPLIRWRLFQLGDNEFKLLHTEHHFLHDGWGYGVFLGELYATYKALNEKAALRLQSPSAQFADFALWQREVMASGAWDHQLAFWKNELAGCLPPPSMPSDRRMNVPRTFEGVQVRRLFPQAVWEDLGRVCSRDGMTRFAWVHAAFQLFIHRYTGAEDFCVGSGFANRRDACLRDMLGMVINTLPIRARFKGVKSFRDLARSASQRLRRASDNQELPFERIVQEINPRREANANPFFNTCIGAYEDIFPHFRSDQLTITSDDAISCGQVKFDLTALLIPQKPSSLDSAVQSTAPLILWEFSTELFSFSTGERMLDHFLCLLESSVREPDRHLGNLSMTDEAERHRVLELGCGPATPPECGTPVHRIFEVVAASAPDNSAVAVGDASLSYHRLNVRANQLASQLVDRGCSACSIVVVALPRGADAIICFLAILKAGAAYLPIDPREPADRLAHLVGLVKARFILTHSNVSSNLPHFPSPAEVLLVDDVCPGEESNLSRDLSPDSPAYVLFTSGSTGISKAVVVPHRAITRLVFGLSEITVGRAEIVLHLAPLNFDASTFEIWATLLHGATIAVHGDDFVDLLALGETLGRHRVTTAWLTSSLFNQIIDDSPEILRGVRQLITGGEALSPGHVAKAQELLPDTRLFNGYGPTETTTFATIYSISRHLPKGEMTVPIGRPIAGTQTLVLSLDVPKDMDVRPALAPIGVPGELYIGGEGVALGYLNLPEVTAESFLFDRGGLYPGRLYRTGDIVRWRADGNLEFVGRTDAQVKIRGYRIEPGEIETTLKSHPDVDNAIVVARENRAGERDLVGYVIMRKDLAMEEWRTYLQGKLPSYMIPSTIVRLAAVPLTASGKIDRAALPKPERYSSAAAAPATLSPAEKMIASVWSDVLDVKAVAPHESFFELGGHSLLATRVVARLQRRFGVEIPLRAVFDNPTLAEMSCFIGDRRENWNDGSELPGVLREEALF